MDYANGKIYKLVSNVVDDIYIGSTCTELKKRKWNHKCCYDCWKNGTKKYVSKSHILYEAGEVEIVLIENFPCKSKDELYARERYWIENTICVNKAIPYKTKEDEKEYGKKYREEHKEEIKEREKKYREERKEDIKEFQKKYREENKEDIKEYKKKYREEHKEEINKKAYQKVPCNICNKELTKGNLSRHKKIVHK